LGKQDEAAVAKVSSSARMSRKHLFALWGTLITVLGTSVVPKIIDMLSDRPSVTQVQDMIAEQTKVLTETVNRHIDGMDGFENALHELDKNLSHLKGLEESLREVVRDCCTRRVRNAAVRLSPAKHDKPEAVSVAVRRSVVPRTPQVPAADADKVVDEDDDEDVPVQVQQKLPDFNPEWIQQKAD